MHVEGWIFDIEMLELAFSCGVSVEEIPVTWNEVSGSKMQLARDSLLMAVDLLLIRANYLTGRWKPSFQ